MAATTTQQAALLLIKAVAEALRDAGTMPAGHLYAVLMPFGCTLGQFDTLIGTMKRAGLITEAGNVLTWIEKNNN